MIKRKFKINNDFKRKALYWASSFDHFEFINFNEIASSFGSFPCILAVDCLQTVTNYPGSGFENLKTAFNKNKPWLFGYFGYDLKTEVENLLNTQQAKFGLPDMYFFQPRHIFCFEGNEVEIIAEANHEELLEQINSFTIPYTPTNRPAIVVRQRVSKEKYLSNIQKIKDHLLEGDIYELNYCMEFYSENSDIDPLQTFIDLNTLSPMPFSVFMRIKDTYLISASPERFLKKEKNKLLSQPIKGTSGRGKNAEEDALLKDKLLNSEKERSENMMIVDLVRNDLARSSKPGSIQVDELFGIYTFQQVHQMISTVSSVIRDDLHFIDAIKNAFPMGSMTGAPKIRAMELIEELEASKRELFSGAAGFINPEGDFDFNVVIRSIIYSQEKKYVSFQVGSAITYDSDPEKEYEECFLKANAMRKALGE